ncbi:DNA-directed RNA polymerase subunit omega [Rickettsia endosymbiont of Polydrusus tereticollis]|uniref:DNA-directed RNA polymerase subunit omega n=1 Tax=Rickettsia endosymbiont of Polydrusus tereticollis TaxID=3066251 RepID=UPI003133299D|nr:DNA-directed RNA polymerase subunit omega [Rickettsia endosymbiont of Oxypoda opaca]
MARITVEDCAQKVNDKFKLVALAAQGAKYINSRAEINPNNKEKRDKPTVSILRQIASGQVSVPHLESELLNRLRTKSRIEPINYDNGDSEIEENVENFDYIPGGSDIYIGEDYSDLDNQVFTDDNFEDEKK